LVAGALGLGLLVAGGVLFVAGGVLFVAGGVLFVAGGVLFVVEEPDEVACFFALSLISVGRRVNAAALRVRPSGSV
jgi:hypothetical protein